MVATFLVSKTARRAHRTITSALQAAASARRALVRIEPGRYPESLLVQGTVDLVALGEPGSVVITPPQGPAIDSAGTVQVTGLVLVGRDADTVCCRGGKLTVEHTRILGHSGVSVHAMVGTAVTLRDTAISNGRTLFAGSSGLIEECRFSDAADNAIAVIEDADVAIHNSRIEGSRIHGVRVSRARARIVNCDVTRTGNDAISADTQAQIMVADCRITDVHTGAIAFVEQSRGTVDNTQVSDAAHGVIAVSGANPLVRRSTFARCRDTGINVHTQGLGRFEDCEVTGAGNVAVFSTTGGAPEVQGCRISNGNVGIAVLNAGGRFSRCEIHDMTGVALRVLESGTGRFSHIQVERCPAGLETNGDSGTTAELTDVHFRDFSQAAVAAIGQSRTTLRGCSATEGPAGFGVREQAQLFAYDCRVDNMEAGGVVVDGNGIFTAERLTVTAVDGVGLAGKDSAYLDVRNSTFVDITYAGISVADSCGGRLADCSITGDKGMGLVHNGLVLLKSLHTSMTVTEHAPEPTNNVVQNITNIFNGPVFHAPVQNAQFAWDNHTVSQEQTSRPT